MRKRIVYKKHNVAPDPVYGRVSISKFINHIMKDGKKDVATKIVYNLIKMLGEKTGENGLEIFEKSIENASPLVETKGRRIGGGTTQIASETNPKRRSFLAMTWLIKAARKRNQHKMEERLLNEIIAAANNEGEAIKKKEEMHRMAASNKTYASLKIK